MFWTLIETSRQDHLKGKRTGSWRWCTAFTWSAMGLNFFSLVFSFNRAPQFSSSAYLLSRVCSSTSDHFFRFILRLPEILIGFSAMTNTNLPGI
nr:protein AAR2 homolog isoform X1 [Ipomoea batatas]